MRPCNFSIFRNAVLKTAVLFTWFFALNLGAQNLTSFVNPLIGTGGHGHTFPGATVPFGSVQLSPDTDDRDWDWSSGYHYSDSSLMGFSHTHLSGTGISDLADILIMPYLGKIQLLAGKKDGSSKGYRRNFNHETEKAQAGFYSVFLPQDKIKCELTAAQRYGVHRYTFPKSDSANIIIDLLHGLDRHRTWLTERVLDSEIQILNDSTIVGYRTSTGWANVQNIYFRMVFSKPFSQFGTALHDVFQPQVPTKRGRNCKAVLTFKTREGEQIEVKVAISNTPFSDKERDADFPTANFETTRLRAQTDWEKYLNAFQIEGSARQKTIFYTAIYHALIAPNSVGSASGKTNSYSTFSFWDIYRAQAAFLQLADPQRVKAFEVAMTDDYTRNGHLPVWTLWKNETYCMIGTPAVPVVAEWFLNSEKTRPDSAAWRAEGQARWASVKASLLRDQPSAPWSLFDKYGYVPNDLETFSVSKTLEMCYANSCAAAMARRLGYFEDAAWLDKRAGYFKNLFDPTTQFFRGKDSAGKWSENFDPSVTDERNFVEATGWQYFFHVQHDIPRLIELVGGKERFSAKLDTLFAVKNIKIDDHILDISGLIGQYAHGNEPCHHVAYLYNAVGESWKTQDRIREICEIFYTEKPDGLCGNEDCGQMSAWYIFSAMGFYPVHPTSGRYDLGAPQFAKITLALPNQKKPLQVLAPDISTKNKYVNSVRLNGQKLMRPYILHEEILAGGTLEFDMRAQPNKQLFKF
jgi:predicted alpha-1,2-mannosidase